MSRKSTDFYSAIYNFLSNRNYDVSRSGVKITRKEFAKDFSEHNYFKALNKKRK